MRFTDKSIRALKPKSQRHEVWEDGGTGLGVRIGTTGKRSWIFMYRFEGRPRRMTLGAFPKVGLADARVALATAKKQIEHGVDPGQRKVASNQAERKAETVSDLIEEYMERHARPKKRTADFDERVLRKDLNERQTLDLIDRFPDRRLIVSPIGAQGFVLGRGNLQLSPEVIRKIGRKNIIIVATPAKLSHTPVMRFDTGGIEINSFLFALDPHM